MGLQTVPRVLPGQTAPSSESLILTDLFQITEPGKISKETVITEASKVEKRLRTCWNKGPGERWQTMLAMGSGDSCFSIPDSGV
jgi:hypothetical protein